MTERRSRVGGWPIAVAIGIVVFLLYVVRYALLPFVFAIAISFIVNPAVEIVQRRLGSSRWPVALAFCLLLYAVFLAPGYWIATVAVHDVMHLVAHGPQIMHDIIREIVGRNGVNAFGKKLTPDTLTDSLFNAVNNLGGLRTILPMAGMGVAAILAVALTLVLLPYFMISGPALAEGAVRLLPPERRSSVTDLLPKVIPVLRRYLAGVFLIVAYTVSVGWIGFGPVFGLPHAVLLAVVVGILEIIPMIGPIISATVVGLTAIQQSSLFAAATLGIFAIVLRLSIDNLVAPLLLGRAARVHPVVIMFAFVCGAMLFGVVGVVLAVPVATCLKIVLAHYYAEPIKAGG